MAESEAVTSSEREEEAKAKRQREAEEALSAVAEQIVEEAVKPEPALQPLTTGPAYKWSHNILDLLHLYEFGREQLTPRHFQRWKETFALGVSAGGIYSGEEDGVTKLLAVFWRTHNPVVDLSVNVPEPALDGNYVYVCWIWNDLGEEALYAFRDYLSRTQRGARFVAHHDQRQRVSGKARSGAEKARGNGNLIVHPLPGPDLEAVEKLLAERNGHGR